MGLCIIVLTYRCIISQLENEEDQTYKFIWL